MKKSLIVMVLIAVLVTACAGGAQPAASDASSASEVEVSSAPAVEVTKLRIAQQFGLGYAALTIADEFDLFEKYLPGLEVEWLQLGSGGAIREAFIAGEVDVASMGIPPFIIGWDAGIPWKVVSGLCVMPLSLQTYKEEVNSLSDLTAEDRIAYPSPGSIQHILLSMAVENELGSPTALDDIGIAMAHPDAAAALINKKDITAHFTSPPYNFEELSNEGIKVLVDGTEAFGTEFTFLVAVASDDFFKNNPMVYSAFVMGLAEASNFINENPEEAAKILAPSFSLDEETTLKYLTWPGMNYVTTPLGLMGFSEFMQNAGYIEKVPEKLSDIAFPNMLAAIGHGQGSEGVLETLQVRP
ncbi:MAG: ABC transporter substrate-binding protein [Pelolinea sp.]|nr:ABC transporter substrate-binding protein [Pelolinea sp.]